MTLNLFNERVHEALRDIPTDDLRHLASVVQSTIDRITDPQHWTRHRYATSAPAGGGRMLDHIVDSEGLCVFLADADARPNPEVTCLCARGALHWSILAQVPADAPINDRLHMRLRYDYAVNDVACAICMHGNPVDIHMLRGRDGVVRVGLAPVNDECGHDAAIYLLRRVKAEIMRTWRNRRIAEAIANQEAQV
jgi:hypothetical protein